jgi:hypothetical protein
MAWAEPEVASDVRFLSNERIKIGVDMTSGGSIFWFSEMPDGPNLLNHADRGRFIQQSFYGVADGSDWSGKPWKWNPVQGGHWEGKPAKVVESEISETEIRVKGVPIHWATGELLEDCVMEEWITLDGEVAKLRFRFSYDGKIEHPAMHQELPAVFVDAALPDLVFDQGEQPWTGGELRKEQPGWPNEYRDTPEQWAAFTGADGRGVGLYFPGTGRITCYRHEGPSGPEGTGCSYFAPIQTIAIQPGYRSDYTVYLTIGSAEEMRERFRGIREAAGR